MYRRLMFIAILLFCAASPAIKAQRADDLTRLLRFPDIHGDMIAFVYGGDIWTVPASGGTARRLTSHPGLELFPKFSPDGRWIAFSGEYSGTRQVFVISVDGGERYARCSSTRYQPSAVGHLLRNVAHTARCR